MALYHRIVSFGRTLLGTHAESRKPSRYDSALITSQGKRHIDQQSMDADNKKILSAQIEP